MEHSCHKCAQPVEDGVPFCAHCGAPQIRVLIPEPLPQPVAAGHEAVQALDPSVLQSPQSLQVSSLPLGWSQTLRPCALAALSAVFLTGLGLNLFVAMLSAGFLAVAFYRYRSPGTVIRAAAGARLGALAGLLWFGLSGILQALLVTILHKGPEIRKEMLEKIQQAASGNSDPQVQALYDYVKTPDGLIVIVVAGLIVLFFVAIALASIGGALAGAFLGRRDRP